MVRDGDKGETDHPGGTGTHAEANLRDLQYPP